SHYSLTSVLRSRRPPIPPLFPYTTVFRYGPSRPAGVDRVPDRRRDRHRRDVEGAPRVAGPWLVRGPLAPLRGRAGRGVRAAGERSEEHTSELQSRENLVCRLLLEKKKNLT